MNALDEDLRHSFRDHDCQTCRYAGLKGLANGQLLSAAERAGFEVLVTVDQNLPYQQRLARVMDHPGGGEVSPPI